jgi:hypothetical protein
MVAILILEKPNLFKKSRSFDAFLMKFDPQ